MTDLPQRAGLPARRYTEQEVAQIIKEASELQQATARAETSSSGLTLAELESVALEAGLDPALVRRAANRIDSGVTAAPPSRFMGAPRSLVLERTLEGEVSADKYEVMALEIQRALGGLGTATTFGRNLQWTSAPMGRRRSSRVVQVTVAPRDGYTTIRIEEPFGQVGTALFLASMGGIGMGLMPLVGVGAGTLGATAIGPGAAVAVAAAGCVTFMGGLYAMARAAYGRMFRARTAKLSDLMSRLADLATS